MKCPICGETASVSFRPFCSERCVLIDLAGWFGELYWIATPEFVDENEHPDQSIESIEDATKGIKRTIH